MTYRNASLLIVSAMLMIAAPPAWPQGDLSADSPLVELLLSEDWTRGEMAQGLLRAMEVAAFEPDDCVPGEEMFDDVPADSPFCPWIEELARRGVTGGCEGGNHCPGSAVSRAQMAVFVVRAIEAAIEEVPEGPPGPQGPAGPAGPPGVSGHQVVMVPSTQAGEFDIEAPCPTGKKVIGGSYDLAPNADEFNARFWQSSPTTAGTGWHVRGNAATPQGTPVEVKGVAVCVQVT